MHGLIEREPISVRDRIMKINAKGASSIPPMPSCQTNNTGYPMPAQITIPAQVFRKTKINYIKNNCWADLKDFIGTHPRYRHLAHHYPHLLPTWLFMAIKPAPPPRKPSPQPLQVSSGNNYDNFNVAYFECFGHLWSDIRNPPSEPLARQ